MMSAPSIFLPGETIPSDILPIPSNPKLPLKLGPGLRHTFPSTITSTHCGPLSVDRKKNAVWIDTNSGRYLPQSSDLIIATVHHSASDYYHCSITPHTSFVLLPHLAFEGATRKTRPQLGAGGLVYARVLKADKNGESEIACYNPSTGKSEGMGELKGGMVFDISLGMARRLLMKGKEGGVVFLDALAEKIAFEVAVGRNGKVWVKAEGVKDTLLVGRALQETDAGHLTPEEQKKMAKKLLNTN